MAEKTNNTKSKTYNPFVSTGGSYENPRLGIVDYNQVQTGFDEGIQPGLDFVKIKEVEFLEKIELAGKEEEILTAGGDFFKGTVFNPDQNMVNEYKDVVNNYRNVLLNRGSSREDINNAKGSVTSLRNSNQSLAHLLQVDTDSKLYSKRASEGINDLFIGQGLEGGLEEFREAYNNGKVKPTTKNVNGNSVGGFEMVDSKGKTVFIDFEGKINPTTIDGKMNLRSDAQIQADAAAFKKNDFAFSDGINFKEKKSIILNNANLTQTQRDTETTKLYTEYTGNVTSQAKNQAKSYILNKPEFFAHNIIQMQDSDFLSEEERNFLNTAYAGPLGSNREYVMQSSNPETETVNSGFPSLQITGAKDLLQQKRLQNPKNTTYSLEDAQNEVKRQLDDKRQNLVVDYVANEYMKEVTGAVIGTDGRVTFRDDRTIINTSSSPITPSGSNISGGGGGGNNGDNTGMNPRILDAYERTLNLIGTVTETSPGSEGVFGPFSENARTVEGTNLNLRNFPGYESDYNVDQKNAVTEKVIPILNNFIMGQKGNEGTEYLGTAEARLRFEKLKVVVNEGKENEYTSILGLDGAPVPKNVYEKYEDQFENPKNTIFEFAQDGSFVSYKTGNNKSMTMQQISSIMRNKLPEGGKAIKDLEQLFYGKAYKKRAAEQIKFKVYNQLNEGVTVSKNDNDLEKYKINDKSTVGFTKLTLQEKAQYLNGMNQITPGLSEAYFNTLKESNGVSAIDQQIEITRAILELNEK